MERDGLIPKGEPLNGTARGWCASYVNMTLPELTELAKAQQQTEGDASEARRARLRAMGKKGGRRRAGARVEAA
jgi:hypothetical protein